MRKVTEQVSNALINGKKKTVNHTVSNGQSISLHGNRIIFKGKWNTYFNLQGDLTPAGRPSPTTRERLNGYLYLAFNTTFGFGQKNWQPVLHGLNDHGNYVVRPIADNEWHSIDHLRKIINS